MCGVSTEWLIDVRIIIETLEGQISLARWLCKGRLKLREEVVEGFENMAKAFIGMLPGDNTGEMLLKT